MHFMVKMYFISDQQTILKFTSLFDLFHTFCSFSYRYYCYQRSNFQITIQNNVSDNVAVVYVKKWDPTLQFAQY